MNGKQSIIEALNNRGIPNAEKIVDYYIAEGIAKYDSVGQFQVRHGVFLDRDVLMRASKEVSNRAIIDDLLGFVADEIGKKT